MFRIDIYRAGLFSESLKTPFINLYINQTPVKISMKKPTMKNAVTAPIKDQRIVHQAVEIR
jgi:hypothetical protein